MAPIDAATQAAIDAGTRVGKRKAAPSFNSNNKQSRIGETDDSPKEQSGIAIKKLADVTGKFMTMFKKEDEGVGGVEGIDDPASDQNKGFDVELMLTSPPVK